MMRRYDVGSQRAKGFWQRAVFGKRRCPDLSRMERYLNREGQPFVFATVLWLRNLKRECPR
jgi:hypothetical protein